MESSSRVRVCMNTSCGVKATSLWKKGWNLKSGDPADLCFNCGCAYENRVYCDTFHTEETGWRECSLCNKRLHCGCSASLPFIEIQDFGGVRCLSCVRPASPPPPAHPREIGLSPQPQTSAKAFLATDPCSPQIITETVANDDLLSLGNILHALKQEASSSALGDATHLPQSNSNTPNVSSDVLKPEASSSFRAADSTFPNLSPVLNGQPLCPQTLEVNTNSAVKDAQQPQNTFLCLSFHSPPETSTCGHTFSSGGEADKSKSTDFQSMQKPRQILPKPPKTNITKASDTTKIAFSPMRVARPPAEGRLRNQLLPRYWPRITDQELQKLSGDLNSTIVPLFEKVLSASDASRIGRLVLPKACAEAYFPRINQSEGLPIKVQDAKANEWTLQFRFWPNNNSRMYVLEGVTPCLQAMQLQAGDTVTFSRIDPGGKLFIGYRKASSIIEMQDIQTTLPNPRGSASAESLYSDVTDGLSAGTDHPVPQSMVGDTDIQLSVLSELSDVVIGDTVWTKSETVQNNVNEEPVQQPKLPSEKKRVRNISSKSKRLLMHNDDAIEFRLTWEETQDLLRPPPSIKPNIVKIEDFEIEEYSEPPVFGKRTFFTDRLSGVEEQWTQCDKCSKWRKLPTDVFIPPSWTCSENIWDLSRSSCAALEEMSSKDLGDVFRISKDFKKHKVAESLNLSQGCEPSGLDALATAATLGDHEQASASATTRHPRHRPGCSCIVCIQPPSGKGKHKASCVCNVCMTVKRRFKTLMMRKKKRLCDREAEAVKQKGDERPIQGIRLVKNAAPNDVILAKYHVKNDSNQLKNIPEEGESSSKGPIDLNFHPIREDVAVDVQSSAALMNLAQAVRDTTDTCAKSSGRASLLHKQKQQEDDSYSVQKDNGYDNIHMLGEESNPPKVSEQCEGDDEGFEEV